jgi:Na+-driven multidrug efflux pump
MIFMNSLQAMGKALPAFIVSISRQGLAYIPALLLLNKFFGFGGLIFAMPLADGITTLLSGTFVLVILSRLKHQEPAPSSQQFIQPVPADEV